jgi:hypothetical protein
MQRKGDKILLAERQTFSTSRKKYRNEKCVKNIFFWYSASFPIMKQKPIIVTSTPAKQVTNNNLNLLFYVFVLRVTVPYSSQNNF